MFPERDRPRIRCCFFGFEEAPEHVFLTPSSLMFRHLSIGMNVGGGWWSSARFENIMLAHIPQGSAAIDAVAALEPGSKITFLGMCGALRQHAVGTIFEPEQAYLEHRSYCRTHPAERRFTSVRIVTVPALAFSLSDAENLAAMHDLADMETGHIFSTAAHLEMPVRAFVVVSDCLPDRPFYSVDADAGTVAGTVRRLTSELRQAWSSQLKEAT